LPSKILLTWYRAAVDEERPDLARESFILASAGGSRCGCAGRTDWRMRTASTTRRGSSSAASRDGLRALLEDAFPKSSASRNSLADRIEQARERVRDRFKRVLGETRGRDPRCARGGRPAFHQRRRVASFQPHRRHAPDVDLGLHVTLVSGLFAWLAAALWAALPALLLRVPARKAAQSPRSRCACYTLIAGFAVPAQRTFLMVTVVALALWSGRIVAPRAARPRAWRRAAARPLGGARARVLALLRRGVAHFLRAVDGDGALRQWLRVQWAITVAAPRRSSRRATRASSTPLHAQTTAAARRRVAAT